MINTREFRMRLRRRAGRAGVAVSGELSDRFESYLRLLLTWNQKINLTGLSYEKSPDETVDRLLVEPLVAARFVSSADVRAIDIGSGGGSPAIPLKLAVGPELRLLMVESKTRKAAFLREAIRQLGLVSAVVESARFEELLSRPDLHEAHDVITLRAVRIEPRTLMSLQAFLKSGGRVLLFRSSGTPSLSQGFPPLEFEISQELGDSSNSHLVVLRKTAAPGRVTDQPGS